MSEPATASNGGVSKYADRAKQLVVDNYNQHHNSGRTPPLELSQVHVVQFTKLLTSWKATIGSTTVKGMLWEVTYNGVRSESYVAVYKKINNVKIVD